MRTDLSYTNYGVSKEAWEWLQAQNRKQLDENPVCQICHKKASVRITGLGTPLACCEKCNDDIYRQIDEQRILEESLDEEYPRY